MRSVHLLGAFFLMTVGSLSAKPAWNTHEVETEYQQGPQEIRVVLPGNYPEQKPYRVLYILPAGPGRGSALGVLAQADLANKYNIILVEMSFAMMPWYGDHPSDPKIRQESYLINYVVPFIDREYATDATSEGRLLIGFSKSGWGAYSLIFRHPDIFGYAAAWDSPFFFDEFRYGMAEIFVTPEHLARYRPDLLVPKVAAAFRSRPRLVLAGEDKWGTQIPTPSGGNHTTEMHALLKAQGIPHVYLPDLRTRHTWSLEWILPVMEELMRLPNPQP